MIAPAPFPEELQNAAEIVREELNLPDDWLNNGPSSDEGGLFQLGLPSGLDERLHTINYGEKLSISFVSRFDQIHFKLFAAIDQPGSYHTADLRKLEPSLDEMETAARWTMTHDVSEGFRELLTKFLKGSGYSDVAARL